MIRWPSTYPTPLWQLWPRLSHQGLLWEQRGDVEAFLPLPDAPRSPGWWPPGCFSLPTVAFVSRREGLRRELVLQICSRTSDGMPDYCLFSGTLLSLSGPPWPGMWFSLPLTWPTPTIYSGSILTSTSQGPPWRKGQHIGPRDSTALEKPFLTPLTTG